MQGLQALLVVTSETIREGMQSVMRDIQARRLAERVSIAVHPHAHGEYEHGTSTAAPHTARYKYAAQYGYPHRTKLDTPAAYARWHLRREYYRDVPPEGHPEWYRSRATLPDDEGEYGLIEEEVLGRARLCIRLCQERRLVDAKAEVLLALATIDDPTLRDGLEVMLRDIRWALAILEAQDEQFREYLREEAARTSAEGDSEGDSEGGSEVGRLIDYGGDQRRIPNLIETLNEIEEEFMSNAQVAAPNTAEADEYPCPYGEYEYECE